MKNSPTFLHRPPSNITLLNDPWPVPSLQKNTGPNRPKERWRPRPQAPRRDKANDRWTYSHTSERLFSIGSIPGKHHVAYRTATNELRFLPI